MGRPKSITKKEVKETIEDVKGPAVTVAEVVDELDLSRRTVERRMNELVDDGELKRKQSGGTKIYWRPSPYPWLDD